MSKTRVGLGARGEAAAADYLLRRGYKIIDRNYRCSLGEIDMIAQKGNYLVVCEVKTGSSSVGDPLEAVTPSKQRRLRQLGEYYWHFETDRKSQVRFDVLAVRAPDQACRIDHVVNAF